MGTLHVWSLSDRHKCSINFPWTAVIIALMVVVIASCNWKINLKSRVPNLHCFADTERIWRTTLAGDVACKRRVLQGNLRIKLFGGIISKVVQTDT